MKYFCSITVLFAATVLIVQGDQVCYWRLGCFSNGRPFFSIRRPINPHVQSPNVVQTKYLLYTRANKTSPTTLDARRPVSFYLWTTYNPQKETKIIVHGYLDNIYKKPWTKNMKDELLISGDYNVIIVDWHKGNRGAYPQAAQNCRLVGAQIARLIKTIQTETKQASSAFHIIGHSLGAHIGGYVGERVKGLGRITGLDPAGPYFTDTDKAVRLDPNDAIFVDVIHTNTESLIEAGFGTSQSLGHADFFPNKGHDQPGCDKSLTSFISTAGLIQGTKNFVKCEHIISISYFTESINSKCQFTAFPCNNEEDYEAGKCTKCTDAGCGLMGFHSISQKPKSPRKYYLSTGDEAPYCEPEMVVTFRFGSDSPKEPGYIKVKLNGEKGSSEFIAVNDEPATFKPNGVYTYSIVVRRLGQVKSVEFSWHHETSFTHPSSWNPFGLRLLKLKLLQVKAVGSNDIVVFCGPDEPIESGKTVTLDRRC